jgi:hypothetical protein
VTETQRQQGNSTGGGLSNLFPTVLFPNDHGISTKAMGAGGCATPFSFNTSFLFITAIGCDHSNVIHGPSIIHGTTISSRTPTGSV